MDYSRAAREEAWRGLVNVMKEIERLPPNASQEDVFDVLERRQAAERKCERVGLSVGDTQLAAGFLFY